MQDQSDIQSTISATVATPLFLNDVCSIKEVKSIHPKVASKPGISLLTIDAQKHLRWIVVGLGIVVVVIICSGIRITPCSLKCSPEQPIILCDQQQVSPKQIRIGSFNLHSFRGKDGIKRPGLSTKLIQDANCDILFLQEVRSQWIDWNVPQVDLLAGYLLKSFNQQYESQFLPTEYTWFHPYFGNSLLSRIEARIVRITPLKNTRGKAYRQMIEVDVPLDGKLLHLLCVHLDLFEDHDGQLNVLLEKFNSIPEPKVLLGDLNTGKGHRELIKYESLGGINVKVDWIIPQGINSSNGQVMTDLLASDHSLLTLDLSSIGYAK